MSQPGIEPRVSGTPCQLSNHWAIDTHGRDNEFHHLTCMGLKCDQTDRQTYRQTYIQTDRSRFLYVWYCIYILLSWMWKYCRILSYVAVCCRMFKVLFSQLISYCCQKCVKYNWHRFYGNLAEAINHVSCVTFISIPAVFLCGRQPLLVISTQFYSAANQSFFFAVVLYWPKKEMIPTYIYACIFIKNNVISKCLLHFKSPSFRQQYLI